MTSRVALSPRSALLFGLVLGTILSGWRDAQAQDPDVLKSRALSAVRRASIMSPNVKAFHLEVALTIYDGAGKNPVQGTLEVIRDEQRRKLSVAFPDADAAVLNTPGGDYSSAHGKLPYYAPLLVRVFLVPIEFQGFGTEAAVRPKNLPPGLPLDCVAVTLGSQAVVRGPEKPIHEVCLDSKTDDLLLVVDDKLEYLRTDLFTFDDQRLAKKIELQVGGVLVGEAELKRLENTSPDETAFVPTSDMTLAVKSPARIPGSLIAGRIIKHESPKYPGAAKAARVQGVVLLHAIIGKDGHITDLSVISSPDDMLSEASLKAVRNWTYEPYLLNGAPTEIDTTITLSFAIGKP